MLDVCAESGWLAVSIRIVTIMQMIMQGRWATDSPLTSLPHVEPYMAQALHSKKGLHSFPSAVHLAQQSYAKIAPLFQPELDEGQIEQVSAFRTSIDKIQVVYEFNHAKNTNETTPSTPLV